VWAVELDEYVAWHLKKETERVMKVIYKLISNHTHTVILQQLLSNSLLAEFTLLHYFTTAIIILTIS
jgi:hypothetical protein